MPATELIQYSGVTVSVATDSAMTTPTVIARVTQLDVNKSFAVNSIDDFDAAAGSIVQQVLGGQTVSVSFGTNLVPSDAGFKAVHGAGSSKRYISLVAVDTESSVTTRTLTLGGYFGQLNEAYAKPTATASITFAADEIVTDTIETAV